MNENNIKFYLTDNGIVMYGGNNPEDEAALKKLQSDYYERKRALRKFCDNVPVIPKQVSRRNGHLYFLLGKDANGCKYWLKQHRWECDWYWSFGYVQSFTQNCSPEKAKDIETHTHFNNLFLNGEYIENYKVFFSGGVTLEDEKIWKLMEAMKEFYLTNEYYELLYRKSTHITSLPEEVKRVISNHAEQIRLKDEVIPALCKYAEGLLDPMNKKEEQ